MIINKVFAYKSITLSMVIDLNLRETKASENEYYYFCSRQRFAERCWPCILNFKLSRVVKILKTSY